jgi:hypothetical protein
MIKYIFISMIFFSFLSACKKDEFTVPDEFKVYIQRFEDEGKLRGKSIDIEKQGVIIEYADFSGQDKVALTKYEDPIRIQVDKTYWDENSDINREFVMFHEFGHGFLEIHDHRNDTLPNGDWASIMRGPPANSQDHNINYPDHREYYLDELFLVDVKHPSWSYRPAVLVLVSNDTAFGLIAVKSSESQKFMVKNPGDKPVEIDSIVAPDGYSSTFTGSIPPYDSVEITVSFKPSEQKGYSGAVAVHHSVLNDREIKPLTFEVSGEGSNSFAIGKWTGRTPFAGSARYQAASFFVNQSGYVCLGKKYNTDLSNEIWELTTDDQWIRKTDFLGAPREYPVGFSIGGKGYLGLGEKMRDLWMYDDKSDTWTRKSDFPGPERIYSIGFANSVKAYFGLGYDGYTLYKDFWEYDPATDTWTRLPDYPGKGNTFVAAFTVHDRIFVGTGCDGAVAAGHANSDFWEYNATTKQWLRKNDVAGGKTNSAISFTINNYGYFGGGTNEDGGGTDYSFWEYDPDKDAWSKKAYMPAFSNGGVYYSTGQTGIFGIGYMTSPYFWEFSPQ